MPLHIANGTIDALTRGGSVYLDDNTHELLPCSLQSAAMTQKVIDAFTAQLQKIDYEGTTFTPQHKFEILTAANLFLKNQIKRHKESLDKGLSVNKGNETLMKVAKLERYVLAGYLCERINIKPLKASEVSSQYQIAINRDLLDKWLHSQTYRGVATGLDERLVEQKHALDAFVLHPADVDFITEGHLDKQIGRHNQQIQVDPLTKHAQLKCEGVYQSVDKIQNLLSVDGGKVLAKADGTRHFYRFDRGLTAFDPEKWKALPVFDQKAARKTPDWRVEVLSTSDHTWLRFKDPQGAVRSVGFSWKEGEATGWVDLCQSVLGSLHVGDKHEYLYASEQADTKKTAIQLTKEQYELLIQEIETIQRTPDRKMFNLVNSNCTSHIRKLFHKVGIDIPSRGTVNDVYLGFTMGRDFLKLNFPPARWLKVASDTILGIARNLVIYILGGGINREKGWLDRKNPGDRAIAHWWDIFRPSQGLFDHPKKLRAWQVKVDERRAIEKEQIRRLALEDLSDLSEGARKIMADLIAEERGKELKHKLPSLELIRPPEGF